MASHEFSFEKLDVWQKARILVKQIYIISGDFPHDEKFGLISQIRRAAVSVPANVAEGSSRFSKKDQSHFYQIAFSSLMELLSHLYVSQDLEYLTETTFREIKQDILEISRMLNALYHS